MKDQIKAFKEKKTYNMEDIRELVEILRIKACATP